MRTDTGVLESGAREEARRAALAAAIGIRADALTDNTTVPAAAIIALQREGRIGSKVIPTGANVPASEVLRAFLP